MFRKISLAVLILVMSINIFGCSTSENIFSHNKNSSINNSINTLEKISLMATDYSQAENWVYAGDTKNKPVDIFFIAPTVFIGGEQRFNMNVQEEVMRKKFLGSVNMEKNIYAGNGNFYAPYYQQLALTAYVLPEDEAQKYLDIAYQDIRTAFEYYMHHENNGRPIVLVGFSQGSQHLLRLMEDYFQQEQYQNLLVSAYLIGWRIEPKVLEQYPHLKMAQAAGDTGVIISFNSEATFVETSLIVPEKTLGINPLNWRTDSTPANKSLNLGTVFTNYEGKIVSEQSKLTGCYLDNKRGTLKVTDISPDEYKPILPVFERGVYHVYDYQLFYRNLQENVNLRVENFLQAKKSLPQVA